MKYLKCFLYNFLTVFFANYILPGIQVIHYTKFPHLDGDLVFPVALALFNTCVYPVLRIFSTEVNLSSIAIVTMVLNFLSYALLKMLPLGIEVRSVEGYLIAALIVTIVSFILSYQEVKKNQFRYEPVNQDPIKPEPPLDL